MLYLPVTSLSGWRLRCPSRVRSGDGARISLTGMVVAVWPPPSAEGGRPGPSWCTADRSLGMEDQSENLRLRSMAGVGDGDILYVSKASLR
jgi:hypothetical protein